MKHPISLSMLATTAALLGSYAVAQMPPPGGSPNSPSQTSPPSANRSAAEVKSECTTAAKKAGLTGREQDDYVKQCVNKGGVNN